MFSVVRRSLGKWLGKGIEPVKAAPEAPPVAAAPAPTSASVQGTATGWLKVIQAADLLALVRAERAIETMWRQSRLAQVVWERDLLASLHRYAEFVQLMPASEAHHHAHVGGLLSHTLEMVVAAMTWRNGHFLPENAPVETMDAERDEWTYAVFFAALLHDIAKPMTDLRIQWRCPGMADSVKWVPIAGSLPQVCRSHGTDAEYLVEFVPKSARDYQAHSRLGVTLLQQIAPPSALSFLSRRPHVLDALSQYLSGVDRTSLVARIVQKADQASTQRALLQGSRARFATATATPLIDLLMQALRDMLRLGTVLPLNRTGAAGWVYDGSVWFVAKRVADAVRQHIKQHAPDESVPGEAKNDRIFDTWQEHGCITPNPQTGQAVWYVVVKGGAGEGATEGEAYEHALTMLRFPLERLFDSPQAYPPQMVGTIQVKEKRGAEVEAAQTPAATQEPGETATVSALSAASNAREGRVAAAKVQQGTGAESQPAMSSSVQQAAGHPAKRKPEHEAASLKAPAFNKPKPASPPGNKRAQSASTAAAVPAAAKTSNTKPASISKTAQADISPLAPGGVDGFDLMDGEDLLGDEDDVRAVVVKAVHKAPAATSPPASVPAAQRKQAAAAISPTIQKPAASSTQPPTDKTSATTVPKPPKPAAPATMRADEQEPAALVDSTAMRQLLLPPSALPAMAARTRTVPVVLAPLLPELPHESASKKVEPSETAQAFMQWLQQGLAQRQLKYNESGAPVHFTTEGMALVSPLIFKLFCREAEGETEAGAESRGLQVQREVIKAGWHVMGPNKVNILRYSVIGRGNAVVGKLSAVVLVEPDRWVLPVPPANQALKLL